MTDPKTDSSSGPVSDLRRLAERATPGPWQPSRFVDNPRYRTMGDEWKALQQAVEALTVRGPGAVGTPECNPVARAFDESDAAYIAAANPQRINKLLDDLAFVTHRHEETVEDLSRAERRVAALEEGLRDLWECWDTGQDDDVLDVHFQKARALLDPAALPAENEDIPEAFGRLVQGGPVSEASDE